MLAAQETIESVFIHPFPEMELEGLCSGLVPTEKIKKYLLEADLRGGEDELRNFIEERLINQTVDFCEQDKRLRLGTFASMKKAVKVKTNCKVAQFNAQGDIFSKISLMQQNRKVHLKDVFFYPLDPVPWALAISSDKLMKTSKSNLMHELEKGATTADSVSIPFVPIFDGIALVRIINCSCLTDNEFADDILKFAVARSFGC